MLIRNKMFLKVDFWPEGTCTISDPPRGINFILYARRFILWNLVIKCVKNVDDLKQMFVLFCLQYEIVMFTCN